MDTSTFFFFLILMSEKLGKLLLQHYLSVFPLDKTSRNCLPNS